MQVHHKHEWCIQKAEEDIRSPETEVTRGCESPCQHWESKQGSLEKQPMYLIADAFIQLSTFAYI